MAKVYDNLGTSDTFKEKLLKLSRAHPADLAPAMALAELYQRQGELPAAISQLEKILERAPEKPNLLGRLAEINHELGNAEGAVAYQQRLAKIQPDPTHQQRLAQFLFEAGREREAVQAWKRLLHARNQTVEAEIQLASLLIRYDLLDEAHLALNRAGERVKTAERRYQIGALLVQLNELESATRHFERILTLRNPHESNVKTSSHTTSGTALSSLGLSLPDTSRFDLAMEIVRRIIDHHPHSTATRWMPSSFAESQAGALAQIFLIAKKQKLTNDFTNRFEAYAASDPNNLEALEMLAAVHILTGNRNETAETINRLIALSPNDYVYHAARIDHALPPDLDYETAEGYLDELNRLSLETRLWFACQLASTLHYQGRRDDAKKLIFEVGFTRMEMGNKVTNMHVISNIVAILIQLEQMDAAEILLSRLVSPPSNTTILPNARQQPLDYQNMYGQLADAYARNGQMEKAIALLWKSLTHTKPVVANMRMLSSGHANFQLVPSNFPVNHIYCGYNWAPLLRKLFIYYWNQDRLDSLYAKFDFEFRRAEGEDKIYYGLALTCFYWWDEAPDKALEILALLQAEFPDSLTILRQATTASILAGRHNEALMTLDRLVDKGPRNRQPYYDLMLQISIFTGNTIKVRELLSRILNAPVNAEALLKIIHELEQSGLRQFAIQVANKAAKRAAGQPDPNLLMLLSQKLELLGRAKDAATITRRARHLVNQRDSNRKNMHQSTSATREMELDSNRTHSTKLNSSPQLRKTPPLFNLRWNSLPITSASTILKKLHEPLNPPFPSVRKMNKYAYNMPKS